MKRVINKIKQRNGESLAEVLIAVLISAVGLLLVSSFVFSAMHIMDRSETKSRELYDALTAAEMRSGDSEAGIVKIKYTGGAGDVAVNLYKDDHSVIVSYEKE